MKLRLKQDETKIYYPDDVGKIVNTFDRLGHEISPELAQVVWEKHSETMCAGWMTMTEDDDLYAIVMRYCEFE
jgi:hypothetical protein